MFVTVRYQYSQTKVLIKHKIALHAFFREGTWGTHFVAKDRALPYDRPMNSEVTPQPKPPEHPVPKRSLWELGLLFAGTSAGIALAEQVAPLLGIPLLREFFYLCSAMCMILLPAEFAFRRGFDLDLFGLSPKTALRGIGWACIIMAVIFPPYIVGYHIWATDYLHREFSFALPQRGVLVLALEHIFLVGLPEEFFYRGYLQRELERVWNTTWFRFIGVSIGPAFITASALFALGHLALVPAGYRLAVFFPSLMFGWLYKKTDSIAGGMLLHGLSNVLLFTLQASYT